MVLVPLFGVHHMFLLIVSSFSILDEVVEVVWLSVDLLFTSFNVSLFPKIAVTTYLIN
jgi:hypothetical protein